MKIEIEFESQLIYINIEKYDKEDHVKIKDYIFQLNKIQKKALIIAYQHLGSSFNIVKSNGFKEWIKNG
jgi:hypothetical protein